jgi:Carboxypeptidase regulatory-like domain/TonB dependent receptor
MRSPSKSILTLISLLVIAGPALSQTDRATLEGTVTDASGAVVVGASVKATAVATAQSQERTTNGSGHYRFPGVAIGFYTVAVSHEGFSTRLIKDVELQVGETHTLDARLEVGQVTQQIEVKAENALAERATAAAVGVIRPEQVQNLPVNGRDFSTLSLLTPWAQDDGGGDERTIRFAGRARDDNNFNFDGVDAGGIQEQAQKSSVRLQVSQDAIAEFRVNSALYTAEYGTQAGGQVNVVTKSGTNQFHGTAFGYLRNSAVDARAFVDPAQVPPFRLGQYGMTFGGPIVREKTFFFLSYEGLRQLQSTTLTAAVPDVTAQKQVLAASPVLCPIIQAFPWRKSTGSIGSCTPRFTFSDALFSEQGGGVDNFVHAGQSTVHEDSWLVRFDHKFTDKTSFYGRATRDISLADAPNGNALDRLQTINHPANYLLALQHSFNTNIFNESKFGINRSPFHNPQASVLPLQISAPLYETLNNDQTDHEVGTTFAYIDNLTITHGRHSFKTGMEIRRIRLNQGKTASESITYATPADPNANPNQNLINNVVDKLDFTGSWCCHGFRRTFFLPYFQDEWKVTPTLTLNLGIRWEYYSVINEAHNRTTIFDLQNFRGACIGSGSNNPLRATEPANCPKNPTAYFPNYRNWDPRVSLAWAPSRFHDKTVIRTGFGIYHGAAQNDDENAALESDRIAGALSAVDLPPGQTLSFGPGYLQTPANFGVNVKPLPAVRALIRSNRRDLYAEEWGLTIDQALPGNFLLETAYMGSHGVRVFARSQENTCIGNSNANGNCVRPLPNFQLVDSKGDVGTSSYHGLLLSLQRRITNGWSFQTNYTYSHSINDGSVGGGEANAPENVQCRACDRGPSAFDVRHSIAIDSVYELPIGPGKPYLSASGLWGRLFGGWSLSGIGSYHTGHPLTVVFSPSSQQIPDGNDGSTQRPDLVPGVSLIPAGGQTTAHWINPAAFAPPPIDPATGLFTHFGTAPNGVVRAPSGWDIDMAIAKNTKLTERFGMQLRLDAFNIFNHTQLGDPNKLDIASTTFGQVNRTVNFNNNNDNAASTNVGTGTPRQLQLSVRFTF